MAGKPKQYIDPERAESLSKENNKLREQEDKAKQSELELAEACKLAGRIEASHFHYQTANVSRLMFLKQAKETELYKKIGTWEEYCNYVGLSRQKVDEDLKTIEIFGEDFLLTCQRLSVGYRDIRKLRKLAHDGLVIVESEAVEIGGEKIPLNPEHKERLKIVIEQLLDEKEKAIEDAKAETRARERALTERQKDINKLNKTIDLLEGKAGKKNATALEEGFREQMFNLRTSFDGYMVQMQPENMAALQSRSEPPSIRMLADYLSTLDFMKKQILGVYDSAIETYGTSAMVPEMFEDFEKWAKSHLNLTE